MSPPDESDGLLERPADGAGVLANLPRTRPQRASARRDAARRRGEAETALETTMAPPERTPRRSVIQTDAAKPRARAAKPARRAPAPRPRRTARPVEAVPRQGFECEGERASAPVSPPGGIELVASAAELLGELAKAGVSAGERLLRDALARIPGA